MGTLWQIGADTGGTFTDLIGTAPDGSRYRVKVLSSGCLRAQVQAVEGGRLSVAGLPAMRDGTLRGFKVRVAGGNEMGCTVSDHQGGAVTLIESGATQTFFKPGQLVEFLTGEEAPVVGARVMTGTPGDAPLPPIALRLGTTRGTNALLERRGAKTLLVVTKGFRDLLVIGDQRRPELFQLDIRKPRPLYDEVLEADERIDAEGAVVQPLAEVAVLKKQLREARDRGCETVAVALLHSYRNSSHEQVLAELLAEAGFTTISLSSKLSPLIKLFPRAQTAVTDAYIGPIMERYLDNVEGALSCGRIHLMTSAGGLVGRAEFRPKDSLLSGPAGGVVGAASIGRQAGVSRIIAFDMGGTSTDVSRIEGAFSYRETHRVGDSEIVSPALRIETVAAGGGSICGFDGKSLFVGPESAGASPGPACYGAGGPLTLTDVNLLAGRLQPDNFGIPVFTDAAETCLQEIMKRTGLSREVLLQGFFDIANERMADAIRTISVREGYDPSHYALVAFGGAGGLHACPLAELLEMKTVLFARDAGLLSAYGLRRAQIERITQRQVLALLDDVYPDFDTWLNVLIDEGRQSLLAEGVSEADVVVGRRVAMMRLLGQESALEVELIEKEHPALAFIRNYEAVFGYAPPNAQIEVVKLQVVVAMHGLQEETEVFSPLKDIGDERPCVLADETATLVIDPGWAVEKGSGGTLRLKRSEATRANTSTHSELVMRELFTNRFRRVVDEMGMQLQRTAVSTNVKERMDYSCAMLDAGGELIANAPHIPVHLGALGLCVREVAATLRMGPGDVVITNHPAFGGSHLPDVTVITPVFLDSGILLGYVASRAHHAEIGGTRPGSMPIDATKLSEEGVVIAPRYLVKGGEPRYDALESLLKGGDYPSRDASSNMADVGAQVAANHRGAETLRELAREFGTDQVVQQMQALKQFSANSMRAKIAGLKLSDQRTEQVLDSGARICVQFRPTGESGLCIDFSTTSPVQPSNLNATPAIVQSAVLYVLRLLVDEDVPLNDGLLEPIEMVLPPCMLSPDFADEPEACPAVMGGNVELSQRLVDTLLMGLGVVACSQGTMNNFVFGDERRSYYETICGGAGAGQGFAGASAVHTHMTNTAITDPEIFEWRYPVRLHQFRVRAGSGGRGAFNGGDGIVREIEFLEPMSVSLLTQRRKSGPEGMGGGGAGMPGAQTRIYAHRGSETLPPSAQYQAEPGERLRIETPGGGGYGKA